MPARSFWRSCCSISLVACRSQWAAAGITWSSVNSSPSYAERIFLFLICVYCSPENASIIWRRIGRPSKWSRAYSVSTSGNSRVSSHRIILFRILILCILSAICSRFGHHPRATLRRDSGSEPPNRIYFVYRNIRYVHPELSPSTEWIPLWSASCANINRIIVNLGAQIAVASALARQWEGLTVWYRLLTDYTAHCQPPYS